MPYTLGAVNYVAKGYDELDVIDGSRSSTTVIGDGTPPVALQGGEDTQATGKRVRTLSLSAAENGGNFGQKKQKLQDKKAVGSPFLLLSC
jgi:SWI/SNF-related matrix-associated actin-dependent regulator of chromatin subfamily A member 5